MPLNHTSKNAMLHELLLALLGFTGDLIVDEREQRKNLGLAFDSDSPLSDECTFKLAPDISFIEPSERDLIERLIKLGFYYREVDRFAKKSRNLSWIRSVTSVHPLERADELLKQSREKKPSVYRRAIANGHQVMYNQLAAWMVYGILQDPHGEFFIKRYLSALISQSFLDIGSVSRILHSIMKLCLLFCWNIENQESNPNTSELENIAEVL